MQKIVYHLDISGDDLRTILGNGVGAEGIRCDKADSIWRRSVAAEGIAYQPRFIFAYLSPLLSTFADDYWPVVLK